MSGAERIQSQGHICSGRAERVYDPDLVMTSELIPWPGLSEEDIEEMVKDLVYVAELIAPARGFPEGYEKVVVKE